MNLTEILKNQLGGTSVTEDFPFPPPVGSSRADSPVWVTRSKTLTEYMFSELSQITDIVASSKNPSAV
jgi:hypothetical protein